MKVNANNTQTINSVYYYDEYEKQRKRKHKEFRDLRKGKRNYDMFSTNKDNEGWDG